MNITIDKVTDYINSFYQPLDDDLKELRELTAVLKEVMALRRSLGDEEAEGEMLLEVHFDEDAEAWSQ